MCLYDSLPCTLAAQCTARSRTAAAAVWYQAGGAIRITKGTAHIMTSVFIDNEAKGEVEDFTAQVRGCEAVVWVLVGGWMGGGRARGRGCTDGGNKARGWACGSEGMFFCDGARGAATTLRIKL